MEKQGFDLQEFTAAVDRARAAFEDFCKVCDEIISQIEQAPVLFCAVCGGVITDMDEAHLNHAAGCPEEQAWHFYSDDNACDCNSYSHPECCPQCNR